MFMKQKIHKIVSWNDFIESKTENGKFQRLLFLSHPLIITSPTQYNTIYIVNVTENAFECYIKTYFVIFKQPLYTSWTHFG